MHVPSRLISAFAVALFPLGLLVISSASVRAGTTTFSNGYEGWQTSGATTILPSGGNPGAYMTFQAIDAFGVNVFNSNPGFIGSVYESPVTISIDVRTDSITSLGNQVPRDLFLELRDTTTPPSNGLPWVSVFYDLGTLTSSTPGWIHYSVTITDPDSSVLPPGWTGYGGEDADGSPILPPGVTFATVLQNVDLINFTTYQPGFVYGFTDFDLSFDNLGVNAVPEPSSLTLLGISASCLAAARWKNRRRPSCQKTW
jgi:PEP-CTERM motif